MAKLENIVKRRIDQAKEKDQLIKYSKSEDNLLKSQILQQEEEINALKEIINNLKENLLNQSRNR